MYKDKTMKKYLLFCGELQQASDENKLSADFVINLENKYRITHCLWPYLVKTNIFKQIAYGENYKCQKQAITPEMIIPFFSSRDQYNKLVRPARKISRGVNSDTVSNYLEFLKALELWQGDDKVKIKTIIKTYKVSQTLSVVLKQLGYIAINNDGSFRCLIQNFERNHAMKLLLASKDYKAIPKSNTPEEELKTRNQVFDLIIELLSHPAIKMYPLTRKEQVIIMDHAFHDDDISDYQMFLVKQTDDVTLINEIRNRGFSGNLTKQIVL